MIVLHRNCAVIAQLDVPFHHWVMIKLLLHKVRKKYISPVVGNKKKSILEQEWSLGWEGIWQNIGTWKVIFLQKSSTTSQALLIDKTVITIMVQMIKKTVFSQLPFNKTVLISYYSECRCKLSIAEYSVIQCTHWPFWVMIHWGGNLVIC